MSGLLDMTKVHHVPQEELRFGVILNGGVSLAVWMGGAVLELDRLTTVRRDRVQPDSEAGHEQPGERSRRVYDALLALTGSQARVDIISGTSAGGINGAALALSQVNPRNRLGLLRDVWVDQGRIESLMRQPFRGSPTSLLKGDEFFLPQLNTTLGLLAQPGDHWRGSADAPLDLSITTTVLHGNQKVTVDSMGQPMMQSVHGARFHWTRESHSDDPSTDPVPATSERHHGHHRRCRDPFCRTQIHRTADRLALAARCTASFPVAFEPAFVPVGSPAHLEPPSPKGLTEQLRLRPDMSQVVADWGDSCTGDRSRYVVDGGLLANTPTRAALEAVERMPATASVRRVMLLVYPHAEAPGPDPADDPAHPPTAAQAVGGIVGALTAQGSRTFVDELEKHNAEAASRRGTRSDILASLVVEASPAEKPSSAQTGARSDAAQTPTPAQKLEKLARELYPHYTRLRRWRTARDYSRWAVERPTVSDDRATALPPGWNYERVRRAAEKAQADWNSSPYLPEAVPTPGEREPRGWRWGLPTALGVNEAVTDLLKQLIWVLPDSPTVSTQGACTADEPESDYRRVEQARQRVSQLNTLLRDVRTRITRKWQQDPLLVSLQPDTDYWTLRLAAFEWQMIGPTDEKGDKSSTKLQGAIERVAQHEARTRTGVEHSKDPEAPADPTVTDEAERLAQQISGALTTGGDEWQSAGKTVARLVGEVIQQLGTVLPVMERYCQHHGDQEGVRDHVAELNLWLQVLRPDGEPSHSDALLRRLLMLDIAATTLGDEVTTGATLPVEVVQLSAQTRNAFARYTRTGDDKLGGMSVARFGGFLKRSWRVNDWTWGRVDAASHLCRVVLDPSRVRRTAVLTGYLFQEGKPGSRAEETVTGIFASLFGDFVPPDVEQMRAQAIEELTPVLDPTESAEDLGASLPVLADVFAWALHLDIVPSELPVLAGAIRADAVDGANARSRGEGFVKEHQDLLGRLDDEPARITPRDRVAALTAFDRAGVGREPLAEEGRSDQMIRTATTAAAVAATVVDSDRSGLAAVKPVTRGLRGAALLPYWAVTGLSGKGVLARSATLLGLSIGAVLLALSLFGALPKGLSGPGAAVGAGALLFAFAIGALRSGTMLHGLVMLTPILPLLAFALERVWGAGDADAIEAAQRGGATVLVVLALATGLIILGTLPSSTGSVWATMDRLADRHELRPVDPAKVGPRRAVAQGWRRTRAAGRTGCGLFAGVAGLALVGAPVWFVVAGPWEAAVDEVRRSAAWLVPLAVLTIIVGGYVAHRFGWHLQVLEQHRVQDADVWEYQSRNHPAGAAAGWAVLYGAGYLVLAAVLLSQSRWLDLVSVRSLLAASLVLGVLLLL
ncbi:MAG TPA: patatin-like protein, partial [Ornithinimicrobium sp.]|uniref:patatin-like protein n=1 Tax=Ornithinimicrobium sp. TaxID=1977084 RepID=UPI002B49B781